MILGVNLGYHSKKLYPLINDQYTVRPDEAFRFAVGPFIENVCTPPLNPPLGTHVTCYLLSFGKEVLNTVYFLLTENIKKGNQGVIV
jgi:hypothetical protein